MRFKMAFLIILSFLAGYFINSFFASTITTNEASTITNQEQTKELTPKEKIVEKVKYETALPEFVRYSLIQEGFKRKVLTKKEWEEFLAIIEYKGLKALNLNNKDNNLFLDAVKVGNLEIVKRLFLTGLFDVNTVDNKNVSALQYASYYGNLALVKYLVDKGASLDYGYINEHTNKKMDALHFALENKNAKQSRELVEFFLKNGFSLEQGDLYYYSSFKHKENKDFTLKILQQMDLSAKNHQTINLFEDAIKRTNDEEILNYFLEQGVNIKGEGFNALHAAIINPTISNEFFEKLIKSGADVNAPLKHLGQTPLMYAVRDHNYEKVKLLLENGADLTQKDNSGSSAYDFIDTSHRYVYKKFAESAKVPKEKYEKMKALLDSYKNTQEN